VLQQKEGMRILVLGTNPRDVVSTSTARIRHPPESPYVASKAAFTANEWDQVLAAYLWPGLQSQRPIQADSAQRDVRYRPRIHGSQEQCDRD
jgi:hypothetical protein